MPGAGYYAPSQNQQSVTGTRSQTNNIQIKETKDGISVHQTQTYVETTDVNKYAKVKKSYNLSHKILRANMIHAYTEKNKIANNITGE